MICFLKGTSYTVRFQGKFENGGRYLSSLVLYSSKYTSESEILSSAHFQEKVSQGNGCNGHFGLFHKFTAAKHMICKRCWIHNKTYSDSLAFLNLSYQIAIRYRHVIAICSEF